MPPCRTWTAPSRATAATRPSGRAHTNACARTRANARALSLSLSHTHTHTLTQRPPGAPTAPRPSAGALAGGAARPRTARGAHSPRGRQSWISRARRVQA
eukprot:6504175-Prymnesium_polylepis.2